MGGVLGNRFGGILLDKIWVEYHGEYEDSANENDPGNSESEMAHWLVSIRWKSDLQGAGTHFWINANTQRIASDPYDPTQGYSQSNATQRRVIVKAIVSAIFKDIVTQWNALPTGQRRIGL